MLTPVTCLAADRLTLGLQQVLAERDGDGFGAVKQQGRTSCPIPSVRRLRRPVVRRIDLV